MNKLSTKTKLCVMGLAALLYTSIAPIKAEGITFNDYMNGDKIKTAESRKTNSLVYAIEGVGSAVLNHENGHLKQIGYDGELKLNDGGGIFHVSAKSYTVIKSKEKYTAFVFGGIGASKESYENARNEILGRRDVAGSEAIALLYVALDNAAYGAKSFALNGYGDVGYITSSTNADWAYGARLLDGILLCADPFFRYLVGRALGKDSKLPERKNVEIRPYVFAGPNTRDAVGFKGRMEW